MKTRIGIFFIMALVIAIGMCCEILVSHWMLPADRLIPGLPVDTYRFLISEWFFAGICFGMMIMFFLVEAWVWKNWHSWNKFCCDHHERVYQAQMGISQGKMLRRK